MQKIVALLLMLAVCMASPAQKTKGKTTQRKQTATGVQKKGNTASDGSPVGNSNSTAGKAKKKSTGKQATTQKSTGKKPTQREQMQADQKRLKQDIEKKKRQKQELDQKVKKQMQDVLVLGGEIDDKKRLIDTIKTDIASLDSTLVILNNEMTRLKKELAERQQRYANSVRYIHRNRKSQNRMMFIFSAKNVNQMYRRTRFMDEYATYQKAQGMAVKQKQAQVEQKQTEINSRKDEKNTLLAKGQREQENLEKQQAQQQQMVVQLQKEQRTVQELIKKEQQQEAELNAKIEKLIAEEIAREKARIEAEKKRKAEELARKERERKEREQRLAEAKAREEKAKADAKAAKTSKEKKAAKQRAIDAENARKTAERDVAESKREISAFVDADPDRKLSGSFASNKGKLPMPITGAYQVVRGFGSNVVEGLSSVHLSSKGLHLKGQPGAMARCVFDGVVSKIYSSGNSYIVMVRHGRYISVYCDLASVSVSAGQKVSTNQTLGRLGPTNTMQFQLRNWTDLLNPRPWLRR